MAKKTAKQRDIDAIKHEQSSRRNIPNEQTRGFLREDERVDLRYAFDLPPFEDPQLVWANKSKEEKLWVDAPVIYKQENISPQMVIEDLRVNGRESNNNDSRDSGQAGELTRTASLFEEDFDGLSDRETVDFYRHDHSWQNRMIFGDSLQVMASLLEREGMREKVQCVYIDPPYGIKFGSNWQVSTRKRDVKDNKEGATTEPESVKAFRDTWHLGIHSYLEYWRDRFLAAHELLKETGSIFVQISDENVHLMRCLLDEVFGSGNFIALIPFRKKTMPFGTAFIEQMNDFMLWYAKNKSSCKYNKLFLPLNSNPDSTLFKFMRQKKNGIRRSLSREEKLNWDSNIGDLYRLKSMEPSGLMNSGLYEYKFRDKKFTHPKNGYGVTKEGMARLIKADRVESSGSYLNYILYKNDTGNLTSLTASWMDTVGAFDKMYVVQTSIKPIERCLLMTTDPGDLVLDPTCGSGTTAFVAEKWGRRWITCDTSRVALALARPRIMSACFPHYELKNPKNTAEGFHYQSVPHITLKDIANNEAIDEIWEKYEADLKPLRVKLGWAEDWQVPRADENAAAQDLVEYNRRRRKRQDEIDASISENATQEILYDKPREDKSVVRVAGPFTVESLLPFKLPAQEAVDSKAEQNALNDGRYLKALIEQLKKAGVENRNKEERIVFSSIEPTADILIPAVGHFLDKQNSQKTAAISFGPQYSTVNESFLQEAAHKAINSFPNYPKGFELLIICGFAFATDLFEQVKNYGKLKVLFAKMDATLADPEQHLTSQKGQSHNLFMVWGEPDIELNNDKNNPELKVVSIKGVDVFNPISNEVSSCSPEEIACWFIDTNYNGDCFFIRQAYFTGDKNPYKQLQKALNSNISSQAWETLRSNTSRPFLKPKTGRIAVKVINHYGDEVTKTFAVS